MSATVTWPDSGCVPNGRVGSDHGPAPTRLYSNLDIRKAIVEDGGGAWYVGALDVVLSSGDRRALRVTRVAADVTTVAAPEWIYQPAAPPPGAPRFSCTGDGIGPHHWTAATLRLGDDIPLGRHSLPGFEPTTLDDRQQWFEVLADVISCSGNYRLSLVFTYEEEGQQHELRTEPVTLFGLADRTTFYQGYQGRDGAIHALPAVRSGADASCSASSATPRMAALPRTWK